MAKHESLETCMFDLLAIICLLFTGFASPIFTFNMPCSLALYCRFLEWILKRRLVSNRGCKPLDSRLWKSLFHTLQVCADLSLDVNS